MEDAFYFYIVFVEYTLTIMANIKRFPWIIVSLLWMGMIFGLSSIPHLASDLPDIWDLVLRKIAHMVEFGLLTFFYTKSIGEKATKSTIVAMALAILYAISDETHQSTVDGRVGSVVDVLIDSVGIVVASIIVRIKTPR